MPLMPLASSSAKPYAKKKKKKKVIRVPFISQDFFMDLRAACKTSVALRLCLLGDWGQRWYRVAFCSSFGPKLVESEGW